MLRKYWMIVSIFVGLLYLWMTHVNVASVSHTQKNSATFTFLLDSKIPQTIKLHLKAGTYNFTNLICENASISFDTQARAWFERSGEEINVALKRGENRCSATAQNYYTAFEPIVAVKLGYIDFFVLFILLGTPILFLLYRLFIMLLDLFKFNPSTLSPPTNINMWDASKIVLWIIALGIVIRVLYFHRFGAWIFQHDWHGHIEMIKYMATHWSLPVPDTGLEFPQQPLYYLLTAPIFALLMWIGLSEEFAIFILGYISLFSSIVFLIYAYRFFRVMELSPFGIRVGMAFLAFTPSFIYTGARINNDALVMGLAAMALYYIVRAYKDGFKSYFYASLITVSLLFMTKVSTAGFELLLFATLIIAYLYAQKEQKILIAQRIWYFVWIGGALLGLTLLRLYLPTEEGVYFHMVNSSGAFPKQILPPLESDYFASFHFLSLIEASQSYVFGADAVRFSLPTYQYGTMFFGEFDYGWLRERVSSLQITMQAIYLIGVVFLVGGVVGYLRSIVRSGFELLLVLLATLNGLLIVKFIVDYPSVCNSDFRYLVPSFVLIGFFIAKGFESIMQYKLATKIAILAVNSIVILEILFMIRLMTDAIGIKEALTYIEKIIAL